MRGRRIHSNEPATRCGKRIVRVLFPVLLLLVPATGIRSRADAATGAARSGMPVKATAGGTFPSRHWTVAEPGAAGLSREKLERFAAIVGGRGCVVRGGRLAHGWGDLSKPADVASAVKPLYSTLLMIAIQEGRLSGPDEPVSRFAPGLKDLDGGRLNDMTWRHLASQTSGYGLSDKPGAAWAYNDFAIALYYDTLTRGVFGTNGNTVLRDRLATPLEFEDPATFEAFGPSDRPGRLSISVRDFARFGLLILRGGRWNDRDIIRPEQVRLMCQSPIPTDMPVSAGRQAPMLAGQRSLGGERTGTAIGPGFYSFNWWTNGTDSKGRRLFPEAPPDTIVASGHGGRRALWIVPSLDLVVSWNDSVLDDHDRCPGNPETGINRALRLLAEAVKKD